jgi:pyruvate dehydrogenase E2 component (dihydrolipoamide acetyltransferase)
MTLSRRQIPTRTPVCRSTARACCGCVTGCREVTDDESPITPFVLDAAAFDDRAAAHPNLNSTWLDTTDGPQIHLHSAVHLGFGVCGAARAAGPRCERCARQDHTRAGGCASRG